MEPGTFYQYASRYSPAEWLEVLAASAEKRVVEGIPFPSFPPVDVQEQYVGHSGEAALRVAYPFYLMAQECMQQAGLTLHERSPVMDFGCGWGRIARFFYRDTRYQFIYLTDHYQEAMDICRDTGMYGNLVRNTTLPPTCFRDGYFDLVVAFSVFSHLSEAWAGKWIEEFSRIIRPGGMLIFTTQMRSFIDYCRQIRETEQASDWHKALSRSFADTGMAYKAYDEGLFLFEHQYTGENAPPKGYGDAIIPRKYIETHWTAAFDLVAFIDDWNRLPQAVVALRRKQTECP